MPEIIIENLPTKKEALKEALEKIKGWKVFATEYSFKRKDEQNQVIETTLSSSAGIKYGDFISLSSEGNKLGICAGRDNEKNIWFLVEGDKGISCFHAVCFEDLQKLGVVFIS